MRRSPEREESMHLLDEAQQTLLAIRQGTVDAFVVEEPEGHRVYTLEGSDLPYSSLVEGIQQSAAMIDLSGCLLYCNPSLAHLLESPRDQVIGKLLEDCVAPEDRPSYQKLLRDSKNGPCSGEIRIRRSDGTLTWTDFSFKLLSQEKMATGVLITDLTAQKQLIELAARLQGIQDEERKRIARDLHDSVGQLLAAVSMNCAVIEGQAHGLDEAASRAASENSALVQQVSREIRTISHLLHPPLLDVAGLASALRWYVNGFSERSNIKVDLEVSDDLGRLPQETEIAVFRIVQECLTNVHRHSGSATASIRILAQDNQLLVQIKDEGKGISPDRQEELKISSRGGVGFRGMQERLKLLGGVLEIQSDTTGTLVNAKLKVA